jgi:Excalibur calcium-binding domain
MLSFSFLLMGCGSSQTEKAQIKTNSHKVPEISVGKVENAVSTIKKEAPTDYKLVEYKPYHLTGQITPEVYALYRPKDVTEGDFTINIIRVYQFNREKNAWERVFNESISEKMQLSSSDAINLAGDKREQMVISIQEGSGAFLSYLLLGSTDHKSVTALLDAFSNEETQGFYQGSYKILKDKHLVFYESDVVAAVYKWDDSGLITVDPTSVAELASSSSFAEEIGEEDLVITYEMNENGKIKANVDSHETVFAEVGQKISLQRTDANTSDHTTRILYSSKNDPYSIDSETGEILAPDIIYVSIIPNGYDWENEFVVYINALDKKEVTTTSEQEYVQEEAIEDSYTEESYFIDADCADFATQIEAQNFYEANGGPYDDPHDLDRDGDGMACDWNS